MANGEKKKKAATESAATVEKNPETGCYIVDGVEQVEGWEPPKAA